MFLLEVAFLPWIGNPATLNVSSLMNFFLVLGHFYGLFMQIILVVIFVVWLKIVQILHQPTYCKLKKSLFFSSTTKQNLFTLIMQKL